MRLERAKAKGNVCAVTGLQPSEYDGMTPLEIEHFISEWKKANKAK